MNKIAWAWRMLTTTRYTRQLEVMVDLQRFDIERLRTENRSFLNSLLMRGGFAAVEEPAARPGVTPSRHRSWPQRQRHLENEARGKFDERTKAEAEGNVKKP